MPRTETGAAAILATWLSPGYPVGAFAWSHGLEWAIAAGDLRDGPSLEAWIGDLLAHGTGRNDAVLLIHAHRAPEDPEPAELARALAASAERRAETEAMGAAFAATTAAAWGTDPAPVPYPVAIGRAAAAHGIAAELAAVLYLHAFAANLVSAAVRLIPLGQTEGQRVLAALLPACQSVGRAALELPLEALGGAVWRADIAAMRHETQEVRLFRS